LLTACLTRKETMNKDPDIETDELLLREQLIDGDKNACSTLFVRYYTDLYAYSLKLTKEEDLSHEIIQELHSVGSISGRK
jgi:hypothetical protein